MQLVLCTDVVKGHSPLPSVLLWGYNLVHDQTRSGEASFNWHKMSGQAQQSGEDHTVQIWVLLILLPEVLGKKEAKPQRYWKIIMWLAKTTSIYLQFLFPFVHFYCSRAHIEKDHLIFQNIFEGQKFPIKIQNKSSDNLRVPLHKPSACNDPKTPLSLAVHLFKEDSTKNTSCQDLSGNFHPPLVQGDGQDWSPPPQPEQKYPICPISSLCLR